RGAVAPGEVGVEFRSGAGTRGKLVVDREALSSGWRLADPPVVIVAGASSPEEAVRTFARALSEHRWEAVLAALSPPVRESVLRELRERQAALQELGPIEVVGDKARGHAGRFELSLERAADGGWKVLGIR